MLHLIVFPLQLYCDLNSSLRKLLNASAGSFWQTGWVYTRVNDRVAFLFNGIFESVIVSFLDPYSVLS